MMSLDRYSVIRTHDCIVIDGPIPVSDLTTLFRAWKRSGETDPGWMMDMLLAGYLRVNMVIGPPEACADWRDQLGIAPEGPPRPGPRQNAQLPRYRIIEGDRLAIQCFTCMCTSYNSNDVMQRYCAHCKTFLED